MKTEQVKEGEKMWGRGNDGKNSDMRERGE